MKKLIYALVLVLVSTVCFADFLITSRKTSVKESPSSQSDPRVQVDEGARLELLDDGRQNNGYYHVTGTQFTGDGWIYRTFVRRFTSQPGGSATTPVASTPASAPITGTVEVRVVDVGPGLCTLIRLPGDKYVIYDAGHWRGTSGSVTLGQIEQFIPQGSTIEMMVLSHTDADHIGAAAAILGAYKVKKVLWGGYSAAMAGGTNSGTFKNWASTITSHPEVTNINLNARDSTIVPGAKLTFGNTIVTFVCGFGKPPASWALTDQAEKINSVSIIMKLEFAGNSILFCGDAVGRHRDDPPTALIATEHFLVNNAAQFMKSKILIAPHHGADNGSSKAFIAGVDPETVIFSAGHPNETWKHPRASTANRYLQQGVVATNMFRTDRGDDEGQLEWDHTRISGCNDGYGDDDIQIVLRSDGTYSVFYVNLNDPCDENN